MINDFWIDFDEAEFWDELEELDCFCTRGTSDEYGIQPFEGSPMECEIRTVYSTYYLNELERWNRLIEDEPDEIE